MPREGCHSSRDPLAGTTWSYRMQKTDVRRWHPCLQGKGSVFPGYVRTKEYKETNVFHQLFLRISSWTSLTSTIGFSRRASRIIACSRATTAWLICSTGRSWRSFRRGLSVRHTYLRTYLPHSLVAYCKNPALHISYVNSRLIVPQEPWFDRTSQSVYLSVLSACLTVYYAPIDLCGCFQNFFPVKMYS